MKMQTMCRYIVSPSTGTSTTTAASMKVTPASSAPSMKGSRGRIGMKGGEGNTASGGTTPGAENRKRGGRQ
jgi:hypothetical protein